MSEIPLPVDLEWKTAILLRRDRSQMALESAGIRDIPQTADFIVLSKTRDKKTKILFTTEEEGVPDFHERVVTPQQTKILSKPNTRIRIRNL